MQYISEKEIDQLTTETGKKLKKEKKVAVILPKDGKGEFWEGGINGHFFRIRKGQTVEVPKSLAKLMEQNDATIREMEKIAEEFQGEGQQVG